MYQRFHTEDKKYFVLFLCLVFMAWCEQAFKESVKNINVWPFLIAAARLQMLMYVSTARETYYI